MKTIYLNNEKEFILNQNPLLVSYNVEMTEITGGTFWKAYSLEEISGEKQFEGLSGQMLGHTSAGNPLMQWYDPVDLTNQRLRKCTKALGRAYIRVSGTWANKTYYDFSENPSDKAPEGYQSVLTKVQWLRLLDFVRDMDLNLLVSLAVCEGSFNENHEYDLSQAELLFKTSKDYGVPIAAIEFMNETNILQISGAPKWYTASQYGSDQDLVMRWVKENYPETLCVGPCVVGMEKAMGPGLSEEEKALTKGGGIADYSSAMASSIEDLMAESKFPLDVYSYHYYNGVSERLESMMPGSHWKPEQATSKVYLDVAGQCCKFNMLKRDKYVPDGEMWVTESGDAGGGGNTWASTYLDVFRTLNELGCFSELTKGIIFHNTLCSSDYGYLKPEEFTPRPNYFAVLLWNKLVGSEVYKGIQEDNLYIYCHNNKKGNGYTYIFINPNDEEVCVKEKGNLALLTADSLRSSVIKLNGKELVLDAEDNLPDLDLEKVEEFILPSYSCAFLEVNDA